MDATDIVNRFEYHAPNSDYRRRMHENIRNELKTAALNLNDILPEGREKSLAITKLEEAMFWANAAIARQP